MQQLQIIIAPAHNNPEREAFGAVLRARQVTRRRKKKTAWFEAKKKQTWKENIKESICSFSRSHPQSRVLISYCFRPKQRQRRRRSKQMTIKLSNKHHPAMNPNADCGRARRESESGGSVLFPVTLMHNLKCWQKKTQNQTSTMKEGERERRRERGGAKHANKVCICALAFVLLAVQLITFIEPDLELNSWTSGALKLRPALFLFVLERQVVVQR